MLLTPRQASRRARRTLLTTLALVATTLVLPAVSSATEWVVTLQDGASIDTVAKVAKASVDTRYTQALTGFTATLTDAQVAQLSGDSRVRSLQENTVLAHAHHGAPTPVPSTQFVPEGVRRVGGLQNTIAKIDSVDQRVNADIAVLDTGVDYTHPDLYVPYRKDCTGDGSLIPDPVGHGTEVAGIAAALDNRFGVVGIAPGARIWSVRIFASDGSLTLESLLCGLDYVKANASKIDTAVLAFENEGSPDGICGVVVNRSRPRSGDRPKYRVLDPVDLAICKATAAGVLFVASAGNGSVDAGNVVPASYPEVLAVSAFTDTDGKPGGLGPNALCLPTERDDWFGSYSNFGRVVDLSAPGTCAVTTFPGNSYTVDTGTSFSAPLVAGAAALVEARNSRSTPLSIAATLRATRENHAIPGDPDGFDEGILNVARL